MIPPDHNGGRYRKGIHLRKVDDHIRPSRNRDYLSHVNATGYQDMTDFHRARGTADPYHNLNLSGSLANASELPKAMHALETEAF